MFLKQFFLLKITLFFYATASICIPTFNLAQFDKTLCTKCFRDWKGEVLSLYLDKLKENYPSFGHETQCEYHPKSPYGLAIHTTNKQTKCIVCKKEKFITKLKSLADTLASIKNIKKLKKKRTELKHQIDGAFASGAFYRHNGYFYLPKDLFTSIIAHGSRYRKIHSAIFKFLISWPWLIKNQQGLSICHACYVRVKTPPPAKQKKHVTWEQPSREISLVQSASSARTN